MRAEQIINRLLRWLFPWPCVHPCPDVFSCNGLSEDRFPRCWNLKKGSPSLMGSSYTRITKWHGAFYCFSLALPHDCPLSVNTMPFFFPFNRHVQTPSGSWNPHLLPPVSGCCRADHPTPRLVRAFLQRWAECLGTCPSSFHSWKLALCMAALVEWRRFYTNKQGANFISFQFERLKKKNRETLKWIESVP